ncbi:hypothetical protein C8Q73DRAFT_131538 [Cubamyces lactineus]|nr:hypothetical protein C8Q73DRAFT_131538 [Cubamyces lactineus]
MRTRVSVIRQWGRTPHRVLAKFASRLSKYWKYHLSVGAKTTHCSSSPQLSRPRPLPSHPPRLLRLSFVCPRKRRLSSFGMPKGFHLCDDQPAPTARLGFESVSSREAVSSPVVVQPFMTATFAPHDGRAGTYAHPRDATILEPLSHGPIGEHILHESNVRHGGISPCARDSEAGLSGLQPDRSGASTPRHSVALGLPPTPISPSRGHDWDGRKLHVDVGYM